MNKLVLLLFLNSFAMVSAQQADNPEPPPQPPFAVNPPPGSSWSVTISISDSAKATDFTTQAANAPKARLVPQSLQMQIGLNQVQLGIITYTDQHQEEFYIIASQVLQKCTNSDKIANWGSMAGDPRELRTVPFPGINWLSLENYLGTEKIGKLKYYKFHEFSKAGAALPVGTECTAWVNVMTHYPLRVQLGNATYNFSEIGAFQKDIQLPENFQKLAHQIQAEQQALDSMSQSHR